MRRAVIEELIGLQFCGQICFGPDFGMPASVVYCLLPPGHGGDCTPRPGPRQLSREERLERNLAAECVHRRALVRQRDHLRNRIAALERRRAWVERYPLFRLEYHARGFARRLRRYWRIAYHRAILAPLGRWP